MLLLVPLYSWALAFLALRRYGLAGRVPSWLSPIAATDSGSGSGGDFPARGGGFAAVYEPAGGDKA